MKIVIFGAGGTIGSCVLGESVARGHDVTAAVRDIAKPISGPAVRVEADATDAASVAEAARGHDVAVSAVGGFDADGSPVVVRAAAALLDGLERAGVRRLIVVGGAGSLDFGGRPLMDDPDFPAAWRPSADAQRQALDVYLGYGGPVDWSYLSPAHEIASGERTGRYVLGLDSLVVGQDGHSRISCEDYAVALVDEIELGRHGRRRFTVASP